MKIITLIMVVLTLPLLLANDGCEESETSSNGQSGGEILVKFKPEVSHQQADSLITQLGLEKVKDIEKLNISVFKLPANLSVEEAVQKLEQSSLEEYAEPNHTYRTQEK